MFRFASAVLAPGLDALVDVGLPSRASDWDVSGPR
jgi:hypothetical protein